MAMVTVGLEVFCLTKTVQNGVILNKYLTGKVKITAESIINLFFSLKEIYAANAKFLMSRAAVQAIRMLKDEKSVRYLV
ncbi:putative phage capsid protein [Candidatus Midichloria mitochondrii IricVA]|uniref:Putative phage capsid protein n=1 Tax=Midichloria mitochondrii (strain IricVA) TaxID=696127 RepID=F7XWQ8_MIDMI|nr:putative phage capsid protein [Candidatus Midichloria mitochondrii IricVA]